MVRRALKLKNRDERIANASKSKFVPTKKNRKQFDVPQNFSIVNNAKEVVTFFNRIEEYILDKKHKTHIFLNMRDVKHITVDALLYLLAIIKNIKSDGNIYSFGGNVPDDYKAKQIVQTSGFLSLMQHKNIETIVNNETITIRTGNQDDAVLVGEICDFIVKNSNLTLKHTK